MIVGLQVHVRVFDPFMQVFQVKSLTNGIFPVRQLMWLWECTASNPAVNLLARNTTQLHRQLYRDEGIALYHKRRSHLRLKIRLDTSAI